MADEELNAEEQAAATAEETAAAEAAAAETAEAAAAEKAAAEEESAKTASETDWRDLLTDDDAKKQASRFESLDAVFKANADMRKSISDRVKIPGEDADEKEVEKFRKAMGIPASADDYKIELPEGMKIDEAEQVLLDAVKPIAHAANVPESVLSTFITGFKELEGQILNEHTADLERHQEAAITELRTEWGKDHEANVNIANRAMNQFGGEDMVKFLNETEAAGGVLANHPQMVRLFAKLGRQMSEDGVILPVDQDEAKNLEEQMDDLTQKAHKAQHTGDRTGADKFFKEREALAARLYGDELSSVVRAGLHSARSTLHNKRQSRMALGQRWKMFHRFQRQGQSR